MISVILPCYNVERWIDRAITSIISQTIGIDMLEVICVDDCSTDNTMSKLLAWEKQYPSNIIVIESSINGRQGQARNVGLKYASGEYVAFVDSDDWIEKNYLEELYNIAVLGNYQVVSCGCERDHSKELIYFDNNNIVEKRCVESKEFIIASEEDRKPFIILPPLGYAAWGKLIQRVFLIENELFFPINLTYEDAYWGSLLHLYVERSYVLDKKLYHYFVNENSTVLTTNSNHHLDCITTQTMLWAEWNRRGFLSIYRQELEIEHIYSAFLAGMKFLILRYSEPDYNVYLLLRTLILQRIPDYRKNKYIQSNIMSEFHMLMLTSLDVQLNKSQFGEFAENVKKIGI